MSLTTLVSCSWEVYEPSLEAAIAAWTQENSENCLEEKGSSILVEYLFTGRDAASLCLAIKQVAQMASNVVRLEHH